MSREMLLGIKLISGQCYTQIEGIDFEETFAPVARLKAIQMTPAFTSFKDFKHFQMDIKSALLNGLF